MTVMGSVARVSADAFRRLPLEAHAILGDVPLQDVTRVALPGGGEGRTLEDVRALMTGGPESVGGGGAKALFTFRRWLGRLFGWDRAPGAGFDGSYVARIPAALVARSRVEPGAPSGIFRTLYELPHESLVEAKNATVHALLCSSLQAVDGGYELYWAVYVRPVSWFTGVYMAVIEPFRRFIVYPSILGGIRQKWERRYPG